ncbi:MAG: MFS transporter [Anaerolineae bacterium]|nr:MFS transporter [Anaerolineae bacterium]
MYSRATSNRLLYTLFVCQSLLSASQIAVYTLITIVAARLAGTESVAGLPSSTLTFAQALAAFPLAVLMGRFGRRLGLSLGYAFSMLGGIIGIIAVIQGIFPLLLVSAALLGIGRAGGDQSRFAAGEMFPEAERARMIGRIVFAGTIGAIVGPVLVTPSGLVMEQLGLSPDVGPWAAMVVLCGIATVIAFFLLRPDPMTIARTLTSEAEAKTPAASEQPARPLSTLLRLPKVQLAIASVLISQTVMVVIMVMTPLHMDHQSHSRDAISLVISAHTLGMFAFSPLTGYLIDRFGRIPMLVVGAMTMIASALLAPVSATEFSLAIALFLLGLGWNFGYVSGSSLLADSLQGEERARVQGVNDSLVFFAAGFGSLAAGSLFASGGFDAVNLAGLSLIVVMVGMIVWFNRPQFRTTTA